MPRSSPELLRKVNGSCASLALTSVMMLAGCADSSDGRLGITGSVTFKGQPVESGRIVLRPLAAGQTAGAKISDGSFQVTGKPGLLPGKYRVEIKAVRDTGKTYTDPESGQTESERESYIPAKYNTSSELEIDIANDADRHFSFELTE